MIDGPVAYFFHLLGRKKAKPMVNKGFKENKPRWKGPAFTLHSWAMAR